MTVSRSPEEARLLEKARRLLPGGILGGYDPPAELRFVVREARGARLYDVSGRESIDDILGSEISLAHGPAEVERTLEAFSGALSAAAEHRGG